LRIGEFLGYPGAYLGLRGEIDELCIWNNACSQSEIKLSMNKKLAGTENGLAGYWSFNYQSGITIPDMSPNGNNGIMNGEVKLVDSDEIYTDVNESPKALPTEFILFQNYPNPFNPATNIKFQVLNLCLVTLKVYNVLGNEVAVIVNKELSPGIYRYRWDAKGMASGVYFYKLSSGKYTAVKKMLLMK